jgi:hypothetical protein
MTNRVVKRLLRVVLFDLVNGWCVNGPIGYKREM